MSVIVRITVQQKDAKFTPFQNKITLIPVGIANIA